MKMPLGLVPQRSNMLPSFRVFTEEAKLQVPTRRPADESGACAGSAPADDGMAAAATPSSARNSRLSIASPQSVSFFLILTQGTAAVSVNRAAVGRSLLYFRLRRGLQT